MILDPIGFKRAMLDAKHEYEVDMERSGWARPARRSVRAPPQGRRSVPHLRPRNGRRRRRPRRRSDVRPDRPPRRRRPHRPLPGRTRTRSPARSRASPTCATAARSRAEEYERKKADLLGRL